jgi:hypothetical protein
MKWIDGKRGEEPNHCHRWVDFQSLSYLSRSLRTDIIVPEAKRKKMRMRAGKEERKEDEMDWWKERRGTYRISVTDELTFRASAIALAPSGLILLVPRLRGRKWEWEQGREKGRKEDEVDWWKERRGTYLISVTDELTFRASAISLAPSGPILLSHRLREWRKEVRKEGRMMMIFGVITLFSSSMNLFSEPQRCCKPLHLQDIYHTNWGKRWK